MRIITKIKDKFHFSRTKFHDERGLTFIELIFVLSIFGILSTVVIFQYGKFAANVKIENLAQDIALRIAQAQKSAISGTLNSNLIPGTISPTYGVYFTTSPDNAQNNYKQFTYFFDDNHDGILKLKSPNLVCPSIQCISQTTITTGEYVSKICDTGKNNNSCLKVTTGVAITFTRPFPDAIIMNNDKKTAFAGGVEIEITSPSTNSKKTIMVSKVGQISVRNGGSSYE